VDFALKERRWPFRLPSNIWLIPAAAVFAFGVTFAVLCFKEIRAQEQRLAALDSQARFAIITVDTKIAIELQQLRDLAESNSFKRNEFEKFYEEARLFAARTRRQVVLHDVRTNQQIFNTAYPLNANLHESARFVQPGELDRVRANEPYISSLFYAALAQKNLIAVAVPVAEGGKVRYLLGVAIDPLEILVAVRDATLVKGTVTAIVDRSGMVLARSENNDRYAGRKAPTNTAARPEPSGRFKGHTFDGAPINLSFLKSNLTGWAAVSFEYDRGDRLWPHVAGLIAALAAVVLSLLFIAVSSARARRRNMADQGEST